MASAWKFIKNVSSRPLSTIIFRPEKLKFHPYSILTRVSNGTGQCNFSGQRDSQNFFVPGQRDNGTEVPSLSRDKGTTGQAKNLAKGRDGPGQPKSCDGTGRDSQNPGQDTGQS